MVWTGNNEKGIGICGYMVADVEGRRKGRRKKKWRDSIRDDLGEIGKERWKSVQFGSDWSATLGLCLGWYGH